MGSPNLNSLLALLVQGRIRAARPRGRRAPDQTRRTRKAVAARKRRQSRLTDDEEPLEFSTVVSEAAFRRALGDTELGPAQLAHVIELAQRPNITVHVLPYAAGLHPSMSGAFAVLTFDSGVAPPFGYQGHAIGGHVVDDQNAVRGLMELWELLRNQALSADESLDWLSELSGKTLE